MTTTLLTRIGAACGAAYVVIAVLAHDVFGSGSPDSTATAHAIGAWWRSHPMSTGDWAAVFLEMSALLCFPVYVVVLAWVMRRAEREQTWLPWLVLVMGTISATVKLASAAPMFALAWRADDGISDGLAAALVDMNSGAFVLTWALDGLMLAAAGAVVLRTGCLPRWQGWWALVTAPLLLVNVAVAISGPPLFLLALLWFVFTGVTLALRGERQVRAPIPVAARG
jgi:hypothetical protein